MNAHATIFAVSVGELLGRAPTPSARKKTVYQCLSPGDGLDICAKSDCVEQVESIFQLDPGMLKRSGGTESAKYAIHGSALKNSIKPGKLTTFPKPHDDFFSSSNFLSRAL